MINTDGFEFPMVRQAPVLLALLLAAACGRGGEAAPAATEPISVGVENVVIAERAELTSGPQISGSLEAEDQATVRAEIGGTVLQVMIEEGQRVNRGAQLLRIDAAALDASYRSAEAAVQSARAANEVARLNAERSSTLAAAGAIAQRDLETATNAVAATQAQLASAQAQLAAVREQVANSRPRAPISGVVSNRAVGAGDVVAPGAALVTIINPGSMRLEASVPSGELAQIEVGSPVEFAVSGYPGRTFTGRIERISPAADPVTRQVPIFVSIPNPGGALVSGLFAEGRVQSVVHEGIVIPENALDTSGPAPTVTRLRGGRAEQVAVQLGIRDAAAERIEVVTGIAAGDTVLSGAARGITGGTPVVVASRESRVTSPKP